MNQVEQNDRESVYNKKIKSQTLYNKVMEYKQQFRYLPRKHISNIHRAIKVLGNLLNMNKT